MCKIVEQPYDGGKSETPAITKLIEAGISIPQYYSIQKPKFRKMLSSLLQFIDEKYEIAFATLLIWWFSQSDKFLVDCNFRVDFVMDGGTLRAGATGFEV